MAKGINIDQPPKFNTGQFSGITLPCNIKLKSKVDDLFDIIRKTDGLIVKEPQTTSWGGYIGYFKDLDGYYWEVAYADSWKFDENDMLIIDF